MITTSKEQTMSTETKAIIGEMTIRHWRIVAWTTDRERDAQGFELYANAALNPSDAAEWEGCITRFNRRGLGAVISYICQCHRNYGSPLSDAEVDSIRAAFASVTRDWPAGAGC